jgi:hypothetical protein
MAPKDRDLEIRAQSCAQGYAAGGSLQSATQREEAREELTATETVFPGTDLRLIFQLVGSS